MHRMRIVPRDIYMHTWVCVQDSIYTTCIQDTQSRERETHTGMHIDRQAYAQMHIHVIHIAFERQPVGYELGPVG